MRIQREVLIITGDRNWGGMQFGGKNGDLVQSQRIVVHDVIMTHVRAGVDLVVLGDANGVDNIARVVCVDEQLNNVVEYARWDRFHGGAGPERNGRMIWHGLGDHVDARVCAFHDDLPSSRGTRNCVEQALSHGMPVENYTSLGKIYTPEMFFGKLILKEQ